MVQALLMTKGHPFDKGAFLGMFDALVADPGNPLTDYTHVEQPAARAFFDPAAAEPWDVVVLYDMPGIRFTGGEPPAIFEDPPERLVTGARALLESGKGMVFLHHAIAGWPAWEEWAHVIGGRFHYQPANLGGVAYPDSGYRHDVTHTVEVVDRTHPVTAGLPERFEITDEVYLAPVFEDAVVPLLRSGHTFTDEQFYSADLAIRGTLYSREGWSHPPGSDLVGWAKHAGNSPVVYVQFGDGAATYAHTQYRRLLGNAIGWAAGDDARAWAADRRQRLGTFA